jgi:hypothetical protein
MSGKRQAGGRGDEGESYLLFVIWDWGIIRQRTEDRGQEEELNNAGMFTL